MKRITIFILVLALGLMAAISFTGCDGGDAPADGSVSVSDTASDLASDSPAVTNQTVGTDGAVTVSQEPATEPSVPSEAVTTPESTDAPQTTPQPTTTPEPITTPEPTTTPAPATTPKDTKKTEASTKPTEATEPKEPDAPVEGSKIDEDVDDEDLDIDIGWEEVNQDELDILTGGDGDINVNE